MSTVRISLRNRPRPGWRFLCGGGAAAGGCFLVQEDDQGRPWYCRLWFFFGLCLSLEVLIDDQAADTIANVARRHWNQCVGKSS